MGRGPPGQQYDHHESTRMSLSDVMRVKKLADNINFLRLYFLKNPNEYKKEHQSLEIIDCIMAIYLFEMTRATRQGSLFSRDSLQFKI
jgi:hypothetical protein